MSSYESPRLPLIDGGAIELNANRGGVMLSMECGTLTVFAHMTAMTARLLAAELQKAARVIDPQPHNTGAP